MASSCGSKTARRADRDERREGTERARIPARVVVADDVPGGARGFPRVHADTRGRRPGDLPVHVGHDARIAGGGQAHPSRHRDADGGGTLRHRPAARATASSVRPRRPGAMACGTARWRRSRSASPSAPMPASSTPARLLKALQEHQFTNISAAATHYRMMRNSGAAPSYRYASRRLSFTGEPIDSETAAFAEATFGRPVCSMYGTTEIGVILVSYPGADGFRRQAGLARQADPGRPRRGARCRGQAVPARRDRRDEGLAARRLDRDQGSRPHGRGRLLLSTAAAPTMSSSRPAGR